MDNDALLDYLSSIKVNDKNVLVILFSKLMSFELHYVNYFKEISQTFLCYIFCAFNYTCHNISLYIQNITPHN